MNYRELIETVSYHNKIYYDTGTSEISDFEYDQLYDSLVELEETQGWKASDSPTKHTGHSAGKVKHPVRLFSLKKVYDAGEIPASFFVETPKIDGTNITLIYKNGKFNLSLTRGNGEYGNDVTYLARHIRNIPMEIETDEDTIIVNGECVTQNEVTNFRNYVSGAFGLIDEEEFKNRNIHFVAHDWLGTDGIDYIDRMEALGNDFGFSTVINMKNTYPSDGIVYRVNKSVFEKDMGYSSKYPRFALALKFREKETAVSTIEHIEWNIGRTGAVTPVATIKPVVLEDATISRVTLHNFRIVAQNQIRVGDVIMIERAGGVIPKFLHKMVSGNDTTEISVKMVEDIVGDNLYLDNDTTLFVIGKTSEMSVLAVHYFIKTMRINGIGERILEKMGIVSIPELYSYNDWDSLGKIGDKIRKEVEISKTRPYHQVLGSLGIPEVGVNTAKKIVKKIPSFENIRDVGIINIEGLGEKTKAYILEWLDDENENWVKKLPLNLSEEDANSESEKETTIKVCVTGSMDITKDALGEILKKYGIEMVPNLDKSCSALINAGRGNSSKYRKAQERGIPIIDFWENRDKIMVGDLTTT